jgi:hypothetical protein
MWQLKRRINEVSREVKGLLDALEELKEDEINLHLMYLSAMHENPKMYEELVSERQVCVYVCVCMYVLCMRIQSCIMSSGLKDMFVSMYVYVYVCVCDEGLCMCIRQNLHHKHVAHRHVCMCMYVYVCVCDYGLCMRIRSCITSS